MEPIFFKNSTAFRKWLEKNHDTAKELLVGFYKKGTGKPNMTWSESVDQAICFGWIDGVTRKIDEESYMIRFTPRRQGSIWSAVNINKVAVLSAAGLMHASGIAAYEKREDKKSKIYSFEQPPEDLVLPPAFEKEFKKHKEAWAYFQSTPLSYRHPAIWWVISAKQEATKLKRLQTLIEDSAAGQRLKQLRR